MASQGPEISTMDERVHHRSPSATNDRLEEETSSSDESGKGEKSVTLTEFPEGGARAWLVAVGAAGVLFCTSGYINAFGVYEGYYQTHQLHDYSPSAISWIGSIQMFFLFGGSLFGGPLFDRHGAKVVWPPAVTLVFSVMMTSLCNKYYQFMLAQGILGGMSMGMTMAPAMASTGQYFHKNRGAAMGIAVAGSSVGGVIFPIALGRMLYNPKLGFGWTVRICGFILLSVVGPSCLCIRARLPPRRHDFLKPAAFKEARYTSLVGAAFLMLLGIFTPFFYLPIYATQQGMTVQLSFYLVSILNGTSTFGRLIPGVLADRFGTLNMLFVFGIISGVLLFCWQLMTSSAAIVVFSALYGFFSGAILSLSSASLAHVAGRPQDIGTYLGMGMAVVAFASFVGPPINGALVTNYQSFLQAQIFSGAVVIAGSLLLIVTKISGQGLFSNS